MNRTHFKQSLAFMQKVGFAEAHVFAYSIRKGTKAEKAHGGGKVQRQKLIRPAEKLLKGHLQNGPGV